MRRTVSIVGVLLLLMSFFTTTVTVAQLSRAVQPPKIRVEQELVDDARIDRLTEWLQAIENHRPGARDEARNRALAWTGEQLRALQNDATSLVALIANPRLTSFGRIEPARRQETDIVYTQAQFVRLRLLACAGRGATTCGTPLGPEPVAETLKPLALHVAAARRNGDFNYLVWRAALLHTDVVTLGSGPREDATAGPSSTAPVLRLQDGRVAGLADVYAQWTMAGAMLEHVVPPEGGKPEPRGDRTVREWYKATITWAEARAQYPIDHIHRALDLFPKDPDLLFLSGCQHEVYATAEIQDPIKGISAPPGFTLAVQSASRELRDAEGLFRRALMGNPGLAPGRVHLGHVLLRVGRYRDAVSELEQALATVADTPLQYDALLFLGAAYERLGQVDPAADAYRRALSLFPSAQSPNIALSELACRNGRLDAALAALERTFEPVGDGRRTDPWWTYYRSGLPDPESLLNRLRERFGRRTE